MRTTWMEVVLLLPLVFVSQGTGQEEKRIVKSTPEETDEILANPGMGWETFHRTSKQDKNLPSWVPSTVHYVRWGWRELEPQQAIGSKPQIPDGWFEIFSWRSDPARVAPNRWPPLSKVIAQLAQQHLRLRQVIGRLTEEHLSCPISGNTSRTVRYVILHGLHDEACHSGEIWLLRKLVRSSAPRNRLQL